MAKPSKNGESKMVFVSPMPNKQWKVKSADSTRADSIHDKKADAVIRARELSQNRRGEMVIQNLDGKIGQKDSHGNDPRSSKG